MVAIFIACALTTAQPPGPHAAGAGTPAPATVPSERTGFRVLRVTDGQTLVLSTEGRTSSVRLLGVARFGPTGDGRDSDELASRFLTDLLRGQFVYLKYEGEPRQEKDGRIPAYVERVSDRLLVNLEVVRHGYGRIGPGLPKDQLVQFQTQEMQAWSTRRGLWGSFRRVQEEQLKPAAMKEKTAGIRSTSRNNRKQKKLSGQQADHG